MHRPLLSAVQGAPGTFFICTGLSPARTVTAARSALGMLAHCRSAAATSGAGCAYAATGGRAIACAICALTAGASRSHCTRCTLLRIACAMLVRRSPGNSGLAEMGRAGFTFPRFNFTFNPSSLY